jgi:anti-sigma regulatory factor (Ser/Thr protein kinase)
MEKKFRKDISSLEAIDAFVKSYAEGHSLDPETVFAVNFVIEEIFTNMVKYQPSGSNDISISCELSGELPGERPADARILRIRMVDYGVEYFDPTAAPAVDTTKPLSERRPGGLGVHLVKQYVDDFKYEYVGNDSVITLVKKLKV